MPRTGGELTRPMSTCHARPMAGRQVALCIGAVALLLGAGCSDDDDGGDAAGVEADDGTDTAEDTGDGDETGETPTGPDDAVAFSDPGGTFRLGTDPTWVLRDDAAAPPGVTFWTVGPITDGFEPNVNAFTQPAPVPDVEAYLDLTEAQAQDSPEITDVEILERRTVAGPGGQLGVLEYRGTVGGVALRFMGVAAVDGERATLVTFTASPGGYAELVDDVEPYLLTVEQT